jgi:serine protease Do
MPAKNESGGLAIAQGVVKVAALVLGFVGTLVSLMALVGAVTANGWARLGVALVVAIVVPAVLVDRLLPDDEPAKARGLSGDVFAVVWLGFTVAFVVGLAKWSAPMLVREGDRLTASSLGSVAKVAYFLGRAKTTVEPTPEPSASAGTASASAAPSAAPVPSASASATPAIEDAGAPDVKPPTKKDPDDKSPAELFKKLSPSVVTVSVKAGELEGGGTGFLVDREGTIATNDHVVSQAQSVVIRFINGASYEDVDLLDEDAGQDVALLRVNLKKPKEGEPPKVEPLEIGDSDKVQVGERVISIGNPLGLEHTLSDGLVSQRRTYVGRQWIQTTAPISPGNSGGPLFNMKGLVIGITTAQVGVFRAQNLNLALPINMLKAHLRGEYPNRRKFGKGPKSSTW